MTKDFPETLRRSLTIALHDFTTLPLEQAALQFWHALEYRSERTVNLNSLEALSEFNPSAPTLLKDLLPVTERFRVLFQLTVDEVRRAGQPGLGFSAGKFENAQVESYLFVTLELKEGRYTRSELANYTRALNKVFGLPVIALFKQPECISIGIVQRRLNKRNESRDVLEKISLIRDVDLRSPHRAHLDILAGLHLPSLLEGKIIGTFVELERALARALDVDTLNKAFFKELSNWFYWASDHPGISFPDEKGLEDDLERGRHRQVSLIRLITRLMFVWFLREKKLVPPELFETKALEALLRDFKPLEAHSSDFYQAVLQNLFFATLNTEMGAGREFIAEKKGVNPGYGVHSLYRYAAAFTNPQKALETFSSVPFLNGGLFECLDKLPDKEAGTLEERIDGFSTKSEKRAQVPNELFFALEHSTDLNTVYGTKGKKYKVRGLINLLEGYKFTVNENTPIEEEVALDPELLGKAFENLLAAYNPETEDTARKKTGSFYTPKDVVDYMVDEALRVPLERTLQGEHPERIGALLDYSQPTPPFEALEREHLIDAIDALKVLDPACGSGAFPIGVLQKLVYILEKLDPGNALWQGKQRAKLEADIGSDPEIRTIRADLETIRNLQLESVRNAAEREAVSKLQERIAGFEAAFDEMLNAPDYARKLFLLENCIYGVDIQPIAVQITKLRCFISLIIDQKASNPGAANRGILPLPNLETQFVAANALLKLEGSGAVQGLGNSVEVEKLRGELRAVRHIYFQARKYRDKKKLRGQDKALRDTLSSELQKSGFPSSDAHKMAAFDPYDQNASAPFFDAPFMFGLERGFDVVLGNPPYVRQEKIKDQKLELQKQYKSYYTGTADLYVYFFARGLELLKSGGVLSFICSNKYFRSGYGKPMREAISKNFTVRQIVDFGDAPVFEAIAYPAIVLFENTRPTALSAAHALSWNPTKHKLEDFRDTVRLEGFSLPQKSLTGDGWRIEGGETLDLLERLKKVGVPLGEYVNGRFYYGIKTGLNEAFVVDRATRDRLILEHPSSAEVLKPFLRGRDVKRWKVEFADQYLIKLESSENKKHPWSGKPLEEAEQIFSSTYPAIYQWLQPFRAGLIVRTDQGKYFWELRSCDYYSAFENPKIMYQEIATYQAFSWDESGALANNKTFIISDANKYLLAIMNSRVMLYQLNSMVQKMVGGAFAMQAIYLQPIRIAKPTPRAESLITTLVNHILTLSSLTRTPQIALYVAFLEGLIDALVYELYLPEDLHAAGRRPLETMGAESWPGEGTRLEDLSPFLERLYDPQHPVRKLVFFLDSLPVVRLIEGKTVGV